MITFLFGAASIASPPISPVPHTHFILRDNQMFLPLLSSTVTYLLSLSLPPSPLSLSLSVYIILVLLPVIFNGAHSYSSSSAGKRIFDFVFFFFFSLQPWRYFHYRCKRLANEKMNKWWTALKMCEAKKERKKERN